jgi:catechol 2,3-dioxygenase-like lactoylglutathione lyase family enzyme
MAKIRHIAYRAADPDAMAHFFANSMGMTIVQKRKNNAIDLSDGTINITLLPLSVGTPGGESPKAGIDHIGFMAEDDAEAARLMEAAGAKKVGTVPLGSAAYYEDKFIGPEGIVVDVGHWVGAAPLEKTGTGR